MATWGIVPAAGSGSRIQPLAFSKELLPVGSRTRADVECPRAVSEYIVERLVLGGASRLCFVIAPGKSDILEYYGGSVLDTPVCYVVQRRPAGLCDAVFQVAPFVQPDDRVLIGLPDTVWFPADGLRMLPHDRLALLLFPVDRPQAFDAVVTRDDGSVVAVQVKQAAPASSWIWGAIGLPGHVLHELWSIWVAQPVREEYLGNVINAYLSRGGEAVGVPGGEEYMDVGTVDGYRAAMAILHSRALADPAGAEPFAPGR